jgi:hypothetical protein
LPKECGSSAAWFSWWRWQFESDGDAEATALQRNNFSKFLLFSDGDLL